MTPDGQDPVELRIADPVEPTLFVDEADLGEIVVRTSHRAESLADGRTRVTYRMEITGLARRRSGPRSDRRSAATSPRCSPLSRSARSADHTGALQGM